jgi:hypothetical protein
MTQPSVQLDRLSLHVGAMSESEARRLAELVGLALGRIPALPKAVEASKVSVDVPDQTGRSVAEIADAVAAAVQAALWAEAVR